MSKMHISIHEIGWTMDMYIAMTTYELCMYVANIGQITFAS